MGKGPGETAWRPRLVSTSQIMPWPSIQRVALTGGELQRGARQGLGLVVPGRLDQVPARDGTEDPALLERHGLKPGTKFHRGAGCRTCLQTGYRGRTVVGELLEVSEHVHRAILERKGAGDIHRIAREQGMQSLWDHAVEKVCLGETSYEQIVENIQE